MDGGGIVGKAGNQVMMLAQRKVHRAWKPHSALEDRKRRQRKEVWFPWRKQIERANLYFDNPDDAKRALKNKKGTDTSRG